MQRESNLSRILWTVVLLAAISLVVANFAQRPLFGTDGVASGFSQPLTLWVASTNPSDEAERVVQQAATRWDTRTRLASAEVLPGGSVAGVATFLDRIHGDPRDLLVISSTTLADIAYALTQPQLSETRLQARHAARLLRSAPPIAVVSADSLLLAVPRDSPLKNIQGLSAAGGQTSTPMFSVAEDTWETSTLATLIDRYGLTGRIPYSAFLSSREAVIDTTSGLASIVLAPLSQIRAELRAGRMRQLPWPRGQRSAPEAWIAILGGTGLSTARLASLRVEARKLYQTRAWRKVLRHDGLSSVSLSAPALHQFVNTNLSEAEHLQGIAARLMRNY